MSLIDDALKKAREQSKKDGTSVPPEAPDADPWSYAPMPDRGARSPLVIGLVVGLVAIAGIAGVLVLRRDRRPEPVRTATSAATPSSSAPVREATPLATVYVPPPPRGVGRSISKAPEPGGPPAAAVSSDVGAPRSAAATPVPTPLAIAAVPVVKPTAVALAAPATPSRVIASAPFPSAAPPPASARPAAQPSSVEPVAMEPLASGSPRIVSRPSRTSLAPSASSSAAPVETAPAAAVPSQRTDISSPPPAPDPAPARRTTTASTPPAPPARTSVGTYTAPNGARIDLGGIVFSTTPVALINGRVVGVGGVVEGLTVVSIEENRVELSGDGVHVYVNLR